MVVERKRTTFCIGMARVEPKLDETQNDMQRKTNSNIRAGPNQDVFVKYKNCYYLICK